VATKAKLPVVLISLSVLAAIASAGAPFMRGWVVYGYERDRAYFRTEIGLRGVQECVHFSGEPEEKCGASWWANLVPSERPAKILPWASCR